jgi:small subunit ribosomal protein S11
MVKKSKKLKKNFSIKNITILTVQTTSNNTIIHAQCSNQLNLIVSAGIAGLTGARRSTVYASQQTALLMGDKLLEKKIKTAIVFFKGFGRGRKSVIKSLKKKKIKILQMFDMSSLAHNGCRPIKKRRL